MTFARLSAFVTGTKREAFRQINSSACGGKKNMKKVRCLLILMSCLMLFGLCCAGPAEAASPKTYKNQLVKEQIKGAKPKDYNYYYYKKNGKKLKSAWKTLRVKGKSRKFYFGKNGKAYKAAKKTGFKNNVAVKKIKGVQYGFDTNAYLVTGLQVTAGFDDGVIFYFDNNGRLDSAVTEELRKAAAQGAPAEPLRALMKQYAGKMKDSYTVTVCTVFNGVQPEDATVEQYDGFDVQYYRMPDNSEIVYQVLGTLS